MTSTTVYTAKALASMDLTNLEHSCASEDIEILCEKAVGYLIDVSGVCLLPKFVKLGRALLSGSGVKLVTVANFPGGNQQPKDVANQIEKSLTAGADEIDVIIPFEAILSNDLNRAKDLLFHARQATGFSIMKAVLETGQLSTTQIQTAAKIALDAGADFLATSTGVLKNNTTLSSADTLLACIKTNNNQVGLKVSGQINTLEKAASYIDLAENAMGKEWISPARFRIGASDLWEIAVAHLRGTGHQQSVGSF